MKCYLSIAIIASSGCVHTGEESASCSVDVGYQVRHATPRGGVAVVNLIDVIEDSKSGFMDLDQATFCPTLWAGSCGSSVTLNGELVGYALRGDPGSAYWQWQDASVVDRWAIGVANEARQRGLLENLASPSVIPQVVDRLAAGAFVWGDQVFGPFATICNQRGSDVWLAGHSIFANESRIQLGLIGLQPVCWVTRDEVNFDVLTESDCILGSLYWEGPHGLVGALARVPPSISFQIRGSLRWWRGEGQSTLLNLQCAIPATSDALHAQATILNRLAGRALGVPGAALSWTTHMPDGTSTVREVKRDELDGEIARAFTVGPVDGSFVILIEPSESLAVALRSRPGTAHQVPILKGCRMGVDSTDGSHLFGVELASEAHATAGFGYNGSLINADGNYYRIVQAHGRTYGPERKHIFAAEPAPVRLDSASLPPALVRVGGLGGPGGYTWPARVVWGDAIGAVAVLLQAADFGTWRDQAIFELGEAVWRSSPDDAYDIGAQAAIGAFDPAVEREADHRLGSVIWQDGTYVVIEWLKDAEPAWPQNLLGGGCTDGRGLEVARSGALLNNALHAANEQW